MNKTLRWLPAVVAPVAIVAGAVVIPMAASAAPALPSRTPQQVLALVAGAHDVAYSGTIAQSSDLGLPQLPTTGAVSPSSSGSDSASSVLDLLTADHTARVFVGGADTERVQVLDRLAERDVVRKGATVWTYDSAKKTATEFTLDARAAAGSDPSPSVPTPAQLADRAIAAIQPSTSIDVITTATVAGRAAYQLELTPKSGSTLVSRVVLSIDAKTGLPLKAVIDARGQKADAFSVGFTSIDFSAPAASMFDFTPPSGTKVTTHTGTAPRTASPSQPSVKGTAPTVTGTGWDSIVTIASGRSTSPVTGSSAKLLDELTTPVTGGRALQTSLLSVLLLDDGRVLVGAVPVASLEAAAR